MAVVTPPAYLGAAGVLHPARLDRLALAAHFAPSASAVGVESGCVAAPSGSMGELSLPSSATVRVNPFLAVVQGNQSTVQGAYIVANDAVQDLALPAQHASQFRRVLVYTAVADSEVSGVASSGTTDRAYLSADAGGPAGGAGAGAASPAAPANALLLGDVLLPPVGQTPTVTSYLPQTVARGGILPVVADAVSAVSGHGGVPGRYRGQYRDHPAHGLERWTGSVWAVPTFRPVLQTYQIGSPQTNMAPGWQNIRFDAENYDSFGIHGGDPYAAVVPEDGVYAVEGQVHFEGLPNGPGRGARITINGNVLNNGGGGLGRYGPVHCTAETGRKVLYLSANDAIRVQGWTSAEGDDVAATPSWHTRVDTPAGFTSTLTVERLTTA